MIIYDYDKTVPHNVFFSPFHKVILSMRKSKMDLSSYLEIFSKSLVDEWYLVEVHGVLPTPVHAKATPHTVHSLSFSQIFFFPYLQDEHSNSTTKYFFIARPPLLLSVL